MNIQNTNFNKQNEGPIHRVTNYSTDLSEQDWLAIHSSLPRVMLESKNRKIDLRNVVDAISYWVTNDVPLQQLPDDLPKPGTVHYFCFRFAHDGTFDKFAQILGEKHPMIAGLRKKMKSLKWIGQEDVQGKQKAKEHSQYVNKLQ